MTEFLKNINLNTVESWGKIFQDIDVFRSIIEKIFSRENIMMGEIGNLTPGSNAVFKVGDYVVKIYAPKEVEALYGDYDIELSAMKIANRNNVRTPQVIAHGIYEDVYMIPYIIMGYARGVEASEVLTSFDDIEKKQFVEQLNDLLFKLNTEIEDTSIRNIENGPCNDRWKMFPPHIQEQVTQYKSKLNLENFVLVHGDLTGENILIHDKVMQVIDFGDVRLAPRYYEYAPIVFELFDCDTALLKSFAEGKVNFLDNIFDSLLIHEFGANIVRDFCNRHLNIEANEFKDIAIVKDHLRNLLRA